jgi:YHS domain-containing protein
MIAKDPVCGMKVDETNTITVVHGGKTYYFCSAACKATFDRSPAKYTGK